MVSADGSASKIIGKEQVEERREVETVVFFFFPFSDNISTRRAGRSKP